MERSDQLRRPEITCGKFPGITRNRELSHPETCPEMRMGTGRERLLPSAL